MNITQQANANQSTSTSDLDANASTASTESRSLLDELLEDDSWMDESYDPFELFGDATTLTN